MFNLNQKEDKFYTMLWKLAQLASKGAVILEENVESLEFRQESANKITELEHEGDVLVKDVIRELNRSFMTPIDREDIFLLVKTLDNIIDDIDSVIHGFIMYNISETTEESKKVCHMIGTLTREVEDLVADMKFIGKGDKIYSRIEGIKDIEHEADLIYRECITNLFRGETDVLNVIKWKEIYKTLEDTIDTCQKVSSIIEGVVMKHA